MTEVQHTSLPFMSFDLNLEDAGKPWCFPGWTICQQQCCMEKGLVLLVVLPVSAAPPASLMLGWSPCVEEPSPFPSSYCPSSMMPLLKALSEVQGSFPFALQLHPHPEHRSTALNSVSCLCPQCPIWCPLEGNSVFSILISPVHSQGWGAK